jgi:hypothetical protein
MYASFLIKSLSVPRYKLQVAGSTLQVPRCRFHVTGSRLQVPGSMLQVPGSPEGMPLAQLRASHFCLPTSVFRHLISVFCYLSFQSFVIGHL